MHTGYYIDRDELNDGLSVEDEEYISDFAFMDGADHFYNEKLCDKNLSLLLHGYCDDFALLLNEVFGYSIDSIWVKDAMLIHAYCTTKSRDGKTIYVDARGCTDDYEEFIAEFKEGVCSIGSVSSDVSILHNQTREEFIETCESVFGNTNDNDNASDDFGEVFDILKNDIVFLKEYAA